MRKLRNLLTVMGLMLSITAMAVPAKRDPRTVRQPDGTELTVRLVGDEFNHYYVTSDDKMVIATKGGYYFAHKDASGAVVASQVLAADPSLRTPVQVDFISKVDQTSLRQASRNTKSRMRSVPQKAIAQTGVGLFPGTNPKHTGSPHYLVILVQYKDVKFNTSYTTDAKTYFTNMLCQEGFSEYSGTGSAYDYFNQASKGKFTPQFDVYGPVTLANNRSYYGGNDSDGNDLAPEKMVTEACQALNSQINFADYDTDGDGEVDNVFIFYAGQGEASYGPEESVWPHAWYVYNGARVNLRLDGKLINRYGCTNEWEQTRPDGVGTFVHEFSHVLGLPDLYVTDYNSSASKLTPGAWDVMDYGPYNNNGCTPPTYSIYERNAMGWMEPKVLTAGEGRTLSLNSIFSDNEGYIIPVSTNEFFLLENRQQTSGTWDYYVPGHGMLIWHIDYNTTIWNQNAPNNTASHQYVDIEEANGTANNTYTSTMAKYPFPGTAKVTSFNKFTPWIGETLNYPLTNIKESNGVVTFDVCGGGIVVNAPTVSTASGTYDNPVTVTITKDNQDDVIKYLILTDNDMTDGVYTAPLTISEPCDFSCWAERSGFNSSEVERRFDFKPATPVITPASGSLSALPQVSISTATQGATIYYTLDGTTPSATNGTIYTAPFTPQNATVTVKAVAVRSAWQSSDVAQATYTYTYTEPHSGEATYNLYHAWDMEGQSGWTTSYADHTLSFTEGTVTMNVNKPASNVTITDYPVTKGSDVIVTMNSGYTPIKGVYLKAQQWGTNAHTITLAYSTNGTQWTTIDNVSSDDFSLLCNDIPAGAVAVKFMFSGTKQIGLQEIRVSYGSEGQPIVIDPVTPPTPDPVDPQLAWSAETATVTIGANDNVFPTLTAPDGLTVTYTSSNPGVATIAADGTVTLVGAGTTVITAATAATDAYTASSVSYTLTVNAAPVTPDEPADGAYILVTDASSLKAGDKIIIVAKDYDYALSTTQNTNNRGQAAVEKDGDCIYPGSDVQIITLEAAGSYFDLNVRTGYLYASSSSANNMKTADSASNNTHASIAIADAVATIKFEGQYTRNVMQYNATNGLFSCYGSASQKEIAIYRLPGEGGVEPTPDPVDPQLAWSAETATVTIGANDNVFPTLTVPEGLAVTYTSSNPGVATIAADGTVTLLSAGSTVITAATTATDAYTASSVSYTLTVNAAPVDPDEPAYEDITGTFSFIGTEAYGMTLYSGTTSDYNPEGTVFYEDGICMALDGNTRWWAATGGNELRFYSGSSFTITAPEKHKVVKVELTGATNSHWTTEPEGYNKGTWTGNADAVTFSTNITKGNTAIKGVNVELLAVPDFNMSDITYHHADDKSITMRCSVAHSNYGHVKHYEVWVIDHSMSADARVLDVNASNIVGRVVVNAADCSADNFAVEVPLTLAGDSGVHHLEVCAQAVLRDNSTQYSSSFSDEGEDANTGGGVTDVDTSAVGGVTTALGYIGVDGKQADVEYFNLQGVRVANPAPGVYIRRAGSTVTKVIVK